MKVPSDTPEMLGFTLEFRHALSKVNSHLKKNCLKTSLCVDIPMGYSHFECSWFKWPTRWPTSVNIGLKSKLMTTIREAKRDLGFRPDTQRFLLLESQTNSINGSLTQEAMEGPLFRGGDRWGGGGVTWPNS